MKKRLFVLRKGLAVTGLIALMLTAVVVQPAFAIFGVEDTVEPGPLWTTQLTAQYTMFGHIWAQDVSTYAKVVETVSQLEKVYANGLQMYNLGVAMSKSFSGPNKAQWITVAQMAVNDYTQDKYGENRGWSQAVSGNPSQVPNVWQQSTIALGNGINLAGQTVGQSPMLARLASIEAMDGSSTKCLSTISLYRGNSLANQLGPILKLAIARMDGTAGTNSQIQQLNILAAEHEQGNTESRVQGQINACLVEQQILANKIQRDAMTEDLNFKSQVDQYNASEGVSWGGGTAQSINSYRGQ